MSVDNNILREWHNIYMRAQRLASPAQQKQHDKHRKPPQTALKQYPKTENIQWHKLNNTLQLKQYNDKFSEIPRKKWK